MKRLLGQLFLAGIAQRFSWVGCFALLGLKVAFPEPGNGNALRCSRVACEKSLWRFLWVWSVLGLKVPLAESFNRASVEAWDQDVMIAQR